MAVRSTKTPGIFRIDFRVNGKREYHNVEAKDLREARRIEQERKVDARRKAPKPRIHTGEHTLSEVRDLDLARSQRKRNTEGEQQSLRGRWARLLEGFGEDRPLSRVSTEAISEYVAWSATRVSAATTRREITVLMRGLAMAKKRGWLADVPVLDVEYWGAESSNKTAGKWHEPEVIVQFLELLPQDVRDFYVVALLTGARATELERITPRDIEPAPRDSPVKAVLALKAHQTKRRKARTLGLADSAIEALRRHAVDLDEPIFGDCGSRRVRNARLACKRLGYARSITARDMRHIHATLVLERHGMATARDVLGHADFKILTRYAHGRDILGAPTHVAESYLDLPRVDTPKRIQTANLAGSDEILQGIVGHPLPQQHPVHALPPPEIVSLPRDTRPLATTRRSEIQADPGRCGYEGGYAAAMHGALCFRIEPPRSGREPCLPDASRHAACQG